MTDSSPILKSIELALSIMTVSELGENASYMVVIHDPIGVPANILLTGDSKMAMRKLAKCTQHQLGLFVKSL